MKISQLLELADSNEGRGKPRLQIFFKKSNQYEDVYRAFKKYGATVAIGSPSKEGYRVLKVWYDDSQKMNQDQLESFISTASPGIKLGDYGFYF